MQLKMAYVSQMHINFILNQKYFIKNYLQQFNYKRFRLNT